MLAMEDKNLWEHYKENRNSPLSRYTQSCHQQHPAQKLVLRFTEASSEVQVAHISDGKSNHITDLLRKDRLR